MTSRVGYTPKANGQTVYKTAAKAVDVKRELEEVKKERAELRQKMDALQAAKKAEILAQTCEARKPIIAGYITYLNKKTESLPTVEGGQKFVPIVNKALKDVKSIQRKNNRGEAVDVKLAAVEKTLKEISPQIAALEKAHRAAK